MRNSITLFLLMCLVTTTTAWAASISETQARSIAARFMTTHAMPSSALKMAHKAPRINAAAGNNGSQASYYVFNGDQRGYVIVAGDDKAPAVLGYSDQGTFDPQQVPEAMQELLDSYAAQIEAITSHDARADAHLTGRAPINPLVKAAFSQNAPYNIKLPFINGKHAYVGCVATATAQILHYWKHPATTTAAIPSYTSSELSIFMPTLPVTTFNWGIIQDTYLTNDTLSAAAIEAARLSLYCAQALQMDFRKNSSSASSSDISNALKQYFGYSSSATFLQRRFYTTEQWENMIYNELQASRPIVYNGHKQNGGHAFVCDGYDGNGMFHINWGWNGLSNGYFLLNVLNPDAQGTGGISGTYGYVESQGIVIGIQPGTATSHEVQVTARQFIVESYNGTRNSLNSDFNATIITHFYNCTDQPISFNYGWALYKDGTMVKMIYDLGQRDDLPSMYYIYPTRTIQFGSGLTSGTYRIVPMFRDNNNMTWRPCLGSDINYGEVVINGNSCTVQAWGASCTPSYQVNDINVTGRMHPNRPVYIDMNLTNTGNTRNDVVYMFANGTLSAEGFIDVEKGSNGKVSFEYLTETPGTVTLKFSLNKDGTNPIATRSITINPMPSAQLSATARVLNVTGTQDKVINGDKYSVELTITNQGNTTYNEDIILKLYKHIYDNYGSNVQTVTRELVLAPNQRKTILIECDNVMDGWKYFTKAYYYSAGEAKSLVSTIWCTMSFPTEQQYITGDVNNDGEVNVSDINALIDYITSGNASHINLKAADCNKDGEININDANALISLIIGSQH